MPPKVWSPLEVACCMRGKVPEWDDTYVEKYVPSEILKKMFENEYWVDEEGFWWGFGYVGAQRLLATNEPVVVLASKYLGQGVYLVKYINPSASGDICTGTPGTHGIYEGY